MTAENIKKTLNEVRVDRDSLNTLIKDRLDYLWDILKYWVVYNYPTFNRINRLKFH